jgi:hypothetical protein
MIDHAGERFASFINCDGDGVERVAVNKVRCAVNGIDDPEIV